MPILVLFRTDNIKMFFSGRFIGENQLGDEQTEDEDGCLHNLNYKQLGDLIKFKCISYVVWIILL